MRDSSEELRGEGAEVITLPEASKLAARKSAGTWLTTRQAIENKINSSWSMQERISKSEGRLK